MRLGIRQDDSAFTAASKLTVTSTQTSTLPSPQLRACSENALTRKPAPPCHRQQ